MNSTDAFIQLDHPGIILGQMLSAITIFGLYLVVRERPGIMPRLVLFLAIAVLACLVGRVGKAWWFFIANIVQYSVWPIMNAIWIWSVLDQKRAKLTGAGDASGQSAVLAVSLVSKKSYGLLSGWIAICLILGIVYVSNLYGDKIDAKADEVMSYAKGYMQANREAEQRGKKDQIYRDSLASALKQKDHRDSVVRVRILTGIDVVAGKVDKSIRNQEVVRQTLNKKNSVVERPRYYVAPAPKGLPQSSFPLPTSIRPVKPAVPTAPADRLRKGKRYSYEQGAGADTSYYARTH